MNLWPLGIRLMVGFQTVLNACGTACAASDVGPAISGPSVQGEVEPKMTEKSATRLTPAERYTPGGAVRVMPDLRLSEQPGVSPPISPGAQERDLRELPPLPPPAPGQPPRVMPDLRESPSNAPPAQDRGPASEQQP
jgi:hypothetical protein